MSCFWKRLNIFYILGSVDRQNKNFEKKKLYRKSMKIIQNTQNMEEKFSDVPKKIRVGPKKVGSVGFPERRHFFFGLGVYTAIPSASFRGITLR